MFGPASSRSIQCARRMSGGGSDKCEAAGGVVMLSDQARVSLVAQGTGAVACELCTSQAKAPDATVVIQDPRGGTVQLAACDWCVQALRRLAAGTGGRAMCALAEGGIPSPPGRRPR